MSFRNEFQELLKSEFGASDREAYRIATQAERFVKETDRQESPRELLERMGDRTGDTPIARWNNTVGFLHGESWDIGDSEGSKNPYKVTIDIQQLRADLKEEYSPPLAELNEVITNILRIEAEGKFGDDFDVEVNEEFLARKLTSTRVSLKHNWNWYMGELEFFYDDYEQYKL